MSHQFNTLATLSQPTLPVDYLLLLLSRGQLSTQDELYHDLKARIPRN
jgi:hypothetical protein